MTLATKKSEVQTQPVKRRDGELYERPYPNPFSRVWKRAFIEGYDGLIFSGNRTDANYREGYETGVAQRKFDLEEMDRMQSSNT